MTVRFADAPIELPDGEDIGEPLEVDGFVCDVCGKTLPTERGRHLHSVRMHGTDAEFTPKAGRKGKASMQNEIQNTYTMIGMVVAFFSHDDGVLIAQHAEDAARAWDHACQTNTSIRKGWEYLTTASVYAELFAAHLPIVVGIMGNHGALPESVVRMASAKPGEWTPEAAQAEYAANGTGYMD